MKYLNVKEKVISNITNVFNEDNFKLVEKNCKVEDSKKHEVVAICLVRNLRNKCLVDGYNNFYFKGVSNEDFCNLDDLILDNGGVVYRNYLKDLVDIKDTYLQTLGCAKVEGVIYVLSNIIILNEDFNSDDFNNDSFVEFKNLSFINDLDNAVKDKLVEVRDEKEESSN